MNRTTAYLLGPELIWLLMLALTGLIIWGIQPLSASDHEKLLSLGWFLPVIGVLLAFVPMLWAPGNQWLWLVRIAVVSLIGVVLVVAYLSDAALYGDRRDAGVGAGLILFSGIGLIFLAGMTILTAVAILAKWPFPSLLKWIAIVISVVCFLGLLLG